MIALLAEGVLPSGKLAELLNITPATCSHHLSRLAELGLVDVEKEGNFRLYSLRQQSLNELRQDVLTLLPSGTPHAQDSVGVPGTSGIVAGEYAPSHRQVSGCVSLDGGMSLEVSLAFTKGRKLAAIQLGRIREDSTASLRNTPEEIVALGVCLERGSTVRVDRAWREIKLAIAGKIVWGTELADGLSSFQRRVFRRLLTVPAGHTTTYAKLGKAAKSSPRAVGRAVARNPWPLLVPCHRVVRTGGGLGGYSAPAGAALKGKLLVFEAGTGAHDTYGMREESHT
jgi:methylated-DNA-[protein]-cysteine S-methyltransferase